MRICQIDGNAQLVDAAPAVRIENKIVLFQILFDDVPEQFVIERADYGASYNLANIRGWYNSTVYNETILILNRTFANNHTLVDYATDPNLDCFPKMSDNSTGQYGVNTSHWNVDWWNNADGDSAEGADAPETTVFSRIHKGDLYIHPPYGLSYFCECDKHANGTVSGCLDKCVGNGVNGTFPDPNVGMYGNVSVLEKRI